MNTIININIYTKKIILIIFFIIILIGGFSPHILASDRLNIKGGEIDYNSEEKTAVIKGDVIADYGKYHFHADEVIVKMKGEGKRILSTPDDIEMSPGDITGCDAENPHYMFRAKKIKIYPNDYLEAYHVVFYELNGKLPLFYLPYLYISLSDERQKLVPEFGYSSKRGWFGKLTYNYRLNDKLPGQLYLDYYQHTGEAYGFRQHFIKNSNHQGYVYYYTQKNKIDLNDLFDKHFAAQYDYEKDNWEANTRLDYKIYDKYNFLKGNFDIKHTQDIQRISLNTDYKQYKYKNDREDREYSKIDLSIDRDFNNNLSLKADYNLDSKNYLESNNNDDKEMELGLNIDKSFSNNLDIELDLKREFDYESGENVKEENSNQFQLDYRWADNWNFNFDYEFEELKKPEERVKTRKDYKSVVSYKYRNLKFETILEREDPNFTEEDGVSFYRLPEVNLNYKPTGPLDYKVQAGNYYEDDTETKGYRGAGEIEYSKRLSPIKRTTFNIKQQLTGRVYQLKDDTNNVEYYDPYQLIYNSELGMKNNLTNRLSIDNSYNVTLYRGESPFNFDQAEIVEEIKNQLNYRISNLMNLKLDSGYDLYNQEYFPLKGTMKVWPLAGWTIAMSTEYNLNDNKFDENLSFTSKYKADNVTADTELEYNLNQKRFHTLENDITYEIPGDWGWYLENHISYDFEESVDKRLEEANITIKKKLHCRELKLTYNYLNKEWLLSYNINIFPGEDITVGQSEQENFIFNFGLEDDLKSE